MGLTQDLFTRKNCESEAYNVKDPWYIFANLQPLGHRDPAMPTITHWSSPQDPELLYNSP